MARVLAIVTARPEFASPWAGRDHVASLALSRLGKTQCAEIVAGITASQSVTADLLEEILAKTDGVPLFVEEVEFNHHGNANLEPAHCAGHFAGFADGAA